MAIHSCKHQQVEEPFIRNQCLRISVITLAAPTMIEDVSTSGLFLATNRVPCESFNSRCTLSCHSSIPLRIGEVYLIEIAPPIVLRLRGRLVHRYLQRPKITREEDCRGEEGDWRTTNLSTTAYGGTSSGNSAFKALQSAD